MIVLVIKLILEVQIDQMREDRCVHINTPQNVHLSASSH